MYANIICENCQLFFPLPREGSLAAPLAREQSEGVENGLNFTWDKLRLGQFWGGDGESTTKFNADQLSASGHVDGSLHGQVRHSIPRFLCVNFPLIIEGLFAAKLLERMSPRAT